MITLHHLDQSRSQRILWLLEELGLPYEIKRYYRNKKTFLAPPELKKIHPLGKSPVITDGDLTIAESGAIIEYLVNKYGPHLKPTSEKEQLQYTYWLHYAEGSLMPVLLVAMIFNKIDSNAPFLIRPVTKVITGSVRKIFINPNIVTHFDYLEHHLSQNEWIAGNSFSAADIQMSFPLEAAFERGVSGNKPHLMKYLAALHARPAYKKALTQN
jgi:glutathione S-transferase